MRKKSLSILFFALLVLSACERDTSYDAFTTCLADEGAVMYGAFWCPHCQDQKEMFGDSIDLLPYVECDPNGKNAQAQLCVEKGVKSYPTWIIDESKVEVGLQSFEALSELTSCPLPGNESVLLLN